MPVGSIGLAIGDGVRGKGCKNIDEPIPIECSCILGIWIMYDYPVVILEQKY